MEKKDAEAGIALIISIIGGHAIAQYKLLILSARIAALSVVYFIVYLVERLYAKIRLKQLSLYSFECILNLVNLCLCLLFYYRKTYYWEVVDVDGLESPELEMKYWENIQKDDDFFPFIYYLAFWSAIMWTRVLLIFRANRFFGPLVNIFFSMLRDLGKFLVLYSIIFWMFLCIAVLFFVDLEQYSTI